jgi:hypothetical protein
LTIFNRKGLIAKINRIDIREIVPYRARIAIGLKKAKERQMLLARLTRKRYLEILSYLTKSQHPSIASVESTLLTSRASVIS